MPIATTSTPSTPSGRIKRSVIQAVIGMVPGIISLLNASHLTLVKAGRYSGISVGGVLLVAVVQNVGEAKGWVKPRGV